MKPEDMLDEIGLIDDKLIIDADTDIVIKKKSTPMRRILIPIAACLVILLAVMFILPLLSDTVTDDQSNRQFTYCL